MIAMRARILRGACLAVLLLPACVTQPTSVTVLDADQQSALLRGLPEFTLEGRVAVRAGDEGWQASVRWRQRGDVSEVRLSGPFGAGALQLRFEADVLTLTTSRGDKLSGEEAAGTLRQQLGFDPPIAELRHWLLAEPAPQDAVTKLEAGANGRPAMLEQQDWQLAFEDYREQRMQRSRVQMPRRIIATRDAVRLRLVVDRWKLGKGR
jgi:outer membrane lipoprotein LolB